MAKDEKKYLVREKGDTKKDPPYGDAFGVSRRTAEVIVETMEAGFEPGELVIVEKED